MAKKGSHLMVIHPETGARTIKEPLLRAIVRDAHLPIEEFIGLL